MRIASGQGSDMNAFKLKKDNIHGRIDSTGRGSATRRGQADLTDCRKLVISAVIP